MIEEAGGAVPHSVAGKRPGEDAGATSSAYYEFQYGWVARHALEMTDPSSELKWILCEWHTDFILGWAESFTPVSVKHREPNSGRWTVATMFSDGGLDTLYGRWDELGRPAQCRWVTNGGLDSECQGLAKACSESDTSALEAWCRKHGFRFRHATQADVLQFITALRIDNDSSRAKDQRIVHIDRIARPILRQLKLSAVDAATVYDAVVSIARAASQAYGGTEPTIWSSSSTTALDAAVLTAAESANRLIRPELIADTARRLATPAAAEPPPASSDVTTLLKKLRRGEVVPTAEMAARRTRMNWTAYEATYSEPLPPAGHPSEFETLRSRVVLEATDAQISAANLGRPYGDRMYEQMRARMRELAAEPSALSTLTPDLLMGLAYDLTARCEIWWSERFDPDAPEPIPPEPNDIEGSP